MSAMALEPLSIEDLAQTPTLFASFMGYAGTSYKTFGELRAIYRERSKVLYAAEDQADDLRVERFIDEMIGNRWTADVVMRIGVFDGIVLAIDGIHRGIAYLMCIERGISPDRLPALRVDC
jgi:hypothetical protein